jgi:hypothetical protein
MVVVSLLGIFGVGFVLAEDLDRSDWVWGCRSARSRRGR